MLEVKDLSFGYTSHQVLKNINLSFDKDHHVCIIGESGCGKSTLLKLIYGLYDFKEGEISWNNNPIGGPKNNLIPGEKNMKYVAQNFDLMNFHTVEENIGKFLSSQDKEKKEQRIHQLLSMVEMNEYTKVKPKYLSGGQQQRIALAQALAQEPEILILDEPFSQIDNFRKNSIRRNLFSYLKEYNILCIVATHDYTDVLSFSDKVVVMKEGRVIHNQAPKILYKNPQDKYTANLFGDINEIKISYFKDINSEKKILIYPYEFIICQSSRLTVQVVNCYFQGNNYLIEGVYLDGIIFFENINKLNLGQTIHLKISDELLNTRISY